MELFKFNKIRNSINRSQDEISVPQCYCGKKIWGITMDFVKIKGKDIQDCFMQMKMKYGPEAHVYNQRVVVEGGLMGTKLMSKKFYEIEIGIPEQQTSKERVE